MENRKTKKGSYYGFDFFMKREIALQNLNRKDFISEEEALFCKNDLEKLLIKNDLEKHTDSLWKLGLIIKVAFKKYNEEEEQLRQLTNYLIELHATILFLMENKNISISSTKRNSHINIYNDEIIDSMKNCLIAKYKESGLDEIPMTYETGEKILKSGQADDWISKYIVDNDIKNELGEYEINHSDIDDEMIEEFIDGEMEKIENISTEHIKDGLESLNNWKGIGTYAKNYHIAFLIRMLLPLFNHNLENKNFRFIYDYCKFFKLIPDKELKSKPQQYIKSIYSNYKDFIQYVPFSNKRN